jgi:tRNA pseudouridine38-40 synthase
VFNIKITIEFNGAGFSGWQVQPGQRTIQGELQRVLETVLRQPVRGLMASGRTDSGVHARAQVANFKVEQEPDLRRLCPAVSSLMRGELALLDAQIVPEDFDTRSATRCKQYSYSILSRPAPAVLRATQVWHVSARLNLPFMQAQARVLEGRHDFTSFRAADCRTKDSIRQIFSSELLCIDELLVYRVVGDGFLKQMVRNIVGTLVSLGRGRHPFPDMQAILAQRDRAAAGPCAPAHALCLDWVAFELPEQFRS